MRRTFPLMVLVGVFALAAGCADDAGEPAESGGSTTSAPSPATTDETVTTTTTSTTTVPVSSAPTTAVTTTSGSVVVPSTTTTEPTTDGPNGLIRLGTQPGLVGVDGASAVDDLTARLGAPTEDTGWRWMPPTLACTGNLDVRSVYWGDFRIVVERRTADAPPRLTGWSLGLASIPVAPERETHTDLGPPSDITTTEGVGLGDPVSAIDDATVTQIDESTWLIPAAGAVTITTDTEQRIVGIATGRNDCIGLDITHLPCERPVPVFELPDGLPAGNVSFDEGSAFWGIENGNAGDDFSNVVSEQIGGIPADDPLAQDAATGPTKAESGDTTVSAVPSGNGGWGFYVFDVGTPCVRVLTTPSPLEVDEAQRYARTLAAGLNPQL